MVSIQTFPDQEIVEALEAAIEQFREIATDLGQVRLESMKC